MLITLESLHICYQKIVKRGVRGGTTVVIFVANDADALCAARILTLLLKSDNIQYVLIPVLSFSQLEKEFEGLRSKESVNASHALL